MHILYAVFSIALALWNLSLLLTIIEAPYQLIWSRLAFSFGVIMVAATFLFSLAFPKVNQWYFKLYIPIAVLAGILFTLTTTSLAISRVEIVDKYIITGDIGPIISPVFGIYVLTLSLVSLVILATRYWQATGIARMQLLYVLIGFAIFHTALETTNFILPVTLGVFDFNNLGPVFSLPMVAMIGYAIIRHQLMDIRVVIQRGLVYASLLTLIVGVYLGLVFTLGFVFGSATNVTVLLSAGLTTIIGIFTVPYIDHHLRKVTDHLFFQDKYDYSEALQTLSETLNKNVELEKMLGATARQLKNIFRVEKVMFLITEGNRFFEDSWKPLNINFPEGYFEERLKYAPILVCAEVPAMIEDERLDKKWREMLVQIEKECKKFGVALTSIIVLDQKIIGIVGFGKKLSGDLFSTEDRQLIQTFSTQAAVAFEKARLYEKEKEQALLLEKKVAERTRELEELQKSQQQMMVDISHQLQTPLTILKSQLESCNGNPDKKKLPILRRAIDDTSKFAYDLLDLARLEMAEARFNEDVVNLSNLLNEIVEYLKYPTGAHKITIETDIQPDIQVAGSKSKLEELITILVSNAIKYMRPDGVREIHIKLEQTPDSAICTIADTGIGIPDADLPQIFERFYRVKDPNHPKVKGTGLGLAIAKQIVLRHNGTINVTSTYGHGSQFVFRLPRLD